MTAGINSALAARIGGWTARPGPEITFAEGIHLVADLRNQVGKAFGYVAEITGLEDAARTAANTETLVVDRRGLVSSLVATVDSLTAPVWTEDEMSWAARQTASAQLGGIIGVMAYRVLGHYDPFHVQRADSPGRIVLTAPNILRFERELDADPRDFHLWVALHEVTHAVQFAAAPWLVGWLRGRVDALLEADLEPSRPSQLLAALKRLPELFADEVSPAVPAHLLSPEQSRILAELTAAMSLLEGHADVIMDAVGPKVVKTVEHLRPRFEARRVARGRFERALRRLAGIEAKSAQYVQGAAFVRAGLAALGHEGFNAVFASAAALPTAAEMDDPPAWAKRLGADRNP
ncbi:MAG: zinc-dependent metalloprotease [Bifidobacteriaceae bacterium]|nr:zinc-dependent metalloprotease [Bifidobacteriaceae bacterium]